MSRDHQPQRLDPLEAFLKALVFTRTTVDAGSTTAAELDKMIQMTTRLLDEKLAEDRAWDYVESVFPHLFQTANHG